MASDDEAHGKHLSFPDTDASHQSEDYGKLYPDNSFQFNFGQVAINKKEIYSKNHYFL